MHYRHPRIGFAFDLPTEWEIDSARVSAVGVMVILQRGDTRLLLQIRRSQGNAAARLNAMTQHLQSVRATHVCPCPAPPFGQSRDIVALSFHISGHQQRWISVGQDGYDYTISHTDDWQDVGTAVDQLAASFVFPAPAHIGRALQPPLAANPAPDALHNGRPAIPDVEQDGQHMAVLPPHRRFDRAYPMPPRASAGPSSGLWHRFSARLRRVW
jgi:hypothetical protein